MKCVNCGKEFHGPTCPYCGEEVNKGIKEKEKVRGYVIILKIACFILTIASFFVPLLLPEAIGAIILSIIFGTSKEPHYNRGKLIFVDGLVILLIIISSLSFLTPLCDKWFSYKKIETTLNIDLPNGSAKGYKFVDGFKNNNVSYTLYKYEITEEQYNKIVSDERFQEKGENDWFIDIVSKENSGYIIYDYYQKTNTKPNDELKYWYIFVQVEKNADKFEAYIYKVEKRKY